ncbi:MAG: hypothetical protein ACREAK_08170 [Nitrosarchaeum sp.]
MKISLSNTYIIAHGGGFTVNIEMPDGSRNYLHSEPFDLDSAIITRELIEEQDIDHMNLLIRVELGYYRLVAVLKNNDESVEFHSRKLNLNDVVYERMQLLTVDDDGK